MRRKLGMWSVQGVRWCEGGTVIGEVYMVVGSVQDVRWCEGGTVIGEVYSGCV